MPAAIEHLLVVLSHAPTDLSRHEVLVGLIDSLGNLQAEVLQIRRIRIALKHGSRRGSLVGVGRGNQHLVAGNTGAFLGQSLGFVENVARYHATIADHDREFRPAVVEHQAAGMQRVVNALGLPVLHAAVHRNGQRRGIDVGGVGSGAKTFSVVSAAVEIPEINENSITDKTMRNPRLRVVMANSDARRVWETMG